MLWYMIRFQIYSLMIDSGARMSWNSVFYIERYRILQDLSLCRQDMLPNDLALFLNCILFFMKGFHAVHSFKPCRFSVYQ